MEMKRLFKCLAAVAVVAGLAACGADQKDQDTCCKPMSFDEVVATRRSVRSYDGSKTISEAQVREVLAAAQEAPSWINYEPTRYYVAMSADKLAAVKEAVGRNKERLDGVHRSAQRGLDVRSHRTEWIGFRMDVKHRAFVRSNGTIDVKKRNFLRTFHQFSAFAA